MGASDLQGGLVKMQTTEPFLWSFSLRRSGIESENLHFYLIFSDATATGPGTRLRSTDTRPTMGEALNREYSDVNAQEHQ